MGEHIKRQDHRRRLPDRIAERACEGKAVDGAGAVKQIRNKFDMLADGYPKTLHLLPEVKNDLVKLCEAYGHEIGDAADTYLGADYGDIVNLIMREAAGL